MDEPRSNHGALHLPLSQGQIGIIQKALLQCPDCHGHRARLLSVPVVAGGPGRLQLPGKLQLTRQPYPLPQMYINSQVKSIFDFQFDDFELVNYQSHPHIKAEVAV